MRKKIFISSLIIFTITIGCFFICVSIQQKIYDTNIHGIIVRNQVWSGNILVDGDILVMPWVRLTILPGTNVTITANKDVHNLFGWMICDGIIGYDLLTGIKQENNTNCGVHQNEPYRDEGHHVSIIILGRLEAIGTDEERITFRSDSETPGIYDWNKFIISSGVLSYANIENYRVLGVSSGVEISHNNLRNIGECGVCMGKDENAKILYNNISYAGHELIDMHKCSPIIQYNNLGPNPARGACIIIDGGSPKIENNRIYGCDVGISFISPPDKPIIENNIFLNNTNNISYDYL